jgi:hypothetical protein
MVKGRKERERELRVSTDDGSVESGAGVRTAAPLREARHVRRRSEIKKIVGSDGLATTIGIRQERVERK